MRAGASPRRRSSHRDRCLPHREAGVVLEDPRRPAGLLETGHSRRCSKRRQGFAARSLPFAMMMSLNPSPSMSASPIPIGPLLVCGPLARLQSRLRQAPSERQPPPAPAIASAQAASRGCPERRSPAAKGARATGSAGSRPRPRRAGDAGRTIHAGRSQHALSAETRDACEALPHAPAAPIEDQG